MPRTWTRRSALPQGFQGRARAPSRSGRFWRSRACRLTSTTCETRSSRHRGLPGCRKELWVPFESFKLSLMRENVAGGVREMLDAVYRSESRRVLATLLRLLGGFYGGKEALHHPFSAALEEWAKDSVPANPR